jgi:hypothetical protein
MPIPRVESLLRERGVEYERIEHPPAYTAQAHPATSRTSTVYVPVSSAA